MSGWDKPADVRADVVSAVEQAKAVVAGAAWVASECPGCGSDRVRVWQVEEGHQLAVVDRKDVELECPECGHRVAPPAAEFRKRESDGVRALFWGDEGKLPPPDEEAIEDIYP